MKITNIKFVYILIAIIWFCFGFNGARLYYKNDIYKEEQVIRLLNISYRKGYWDGVSAFTKVTSKSLDSIPMSTLLENQFLKDSANNYHDFIHAVIIVDKAKQ